MYASHLVALYLFLVVPCSHLLAGYMGVDIGTYEELIAHNVETVEQIRQHIMADSLQFLSHEGMLRAVREGLSDKTNAGEDRRVGHCSACFTGEYPLELDDW